MAAKKQEEVRERDITGLRYFQDLLPLFDRLHGVGCDRDKAGNRDLFMDQYCVLILLFLFNPVVRSLRGLQQASELKENLGAHGPRSARSQKQRRSLTPIGCGKSSVNCSIR